MPMNDKWEILHGDALKLRVVGEVREAAES